MKKYIDLFITMLKIGLFTFGGGYAMIALLENEFVSRRKWIEKNEFLDMVAIAESTPGPIAINAATYIGYRVLRFRGSLIRNLLKYKGVQAFLNGIRPCVIGLILSTSIILFFSTVFSMQQFESTISLDIRGLIILFIIFILQFIVKAKKHTETSPIVLILSSACLGMVLYSI